ncbi:LCCL domain-containing protein [Plasmodium berghei]|uniref:LCCL domain-containing protein, putative n=2 Tax=Plasmodium berghei TaxID=5821 RepID=A0A509AF04_PLABA|nr:LCCL domain-containing protein, putative [Plasmodium berghei ANKA]CXH86529.1 LCCL domain-containing protein [Plasmodium berghei]SCL89999.1 LCCL domain-containing protein [Plasmodium berghei]SCM15195.1 LCCL domain-containing protein [Plasmodium berghei]SCM16990.1 LCCL domain-containing protein [Plasmodium berghei]SCN21824.1 LCCL domain-containing protein [Plasmodium berghei]|eukprot:XP_034419771.1 LCCL domain-containing protein, putative [Plasmodium berghei ANKA]
MKRLDCIIFIFLVITTILIYSKEQGNSLEKITEFRQQHRKTLDGRLCSAAFLHDDQTYTDCANTTSPDGTTGREWCYVEVQLLGKGERDWDYCAGVINYDKIRIDAKRMFEGKSLEADRLNDRLNSLKLRINSMVHKYDLLCGNKHELINSRINKINDWIKKSSDSINKIEYNSNELENSKKIIKKIDEDIKKEKENLKNSDEICENVKGYENESITYGLKASYFNNPFFEGIPIISKIIKDINFIYNNKSPSGNLISFYKYSIRYEGYLLAPVSGIYTIIVDSDCSVRIFINNRIVIIKDFEEVIRHINNNNNVNEIKTEKNYEKNKVHYIIDNKTNNISKRVSNPIELIGGEKNKIIVEISHLSNLKYEKGESSYFKLLWKSSRINEQEIGSNYLYSENFISNSRFSSVDPELFEIGLLDVNEMAYKNETDWIIENISNKMRYNDLHLLRTFIEPKFDSFSLEVSGNSNLYIATPIDKEFPLVWINESIIKIQNTNDTIDLLNIKSKEQTKLKIWFIPLKNKTYINFQNKKNIPFLLFLQKRKILPTICTGEEEILSSPENINFKECVESSSISKQFNCMSSLNTYHIDKKHNIWKTANGSIGEYITIYFKKPVQINKFRFKPQDNILTWPSEILLHFDDTKILVPIFYTSNIEYNTKKFEHSIITTSVKIEIRDMFVNNLETGGSFELIGNSCNIIDNEYMNHHAIIDVVDCDNTLNDIPDINPLIYGDIFIVSCPYNCIKNAESSNKNIYGSDLYSLESPICKAAVHAGICLKNVNDKDVNNLNEYEKECRFLLLIKELNGSDFIGKLQNNVLSINKHIEEQNEILSFKISQIIPTKINNFSPLYYSIPNSYSIVFKNKDDLKIPNKFLVDSGEVFIDYGNFGYGWKRKVDSNISLELKENKKNEINSVKFQDVRSKIEPINNFFHNIMYSDGIVFPPASTNEQCVSKLTCESNYWTFKVYENGNYLIQILIGNIYFDSIQKNFIEVNGVSVIKNVELKSNEYYVGIKNIQINDNKLILTSTCLESQYSCGNSRTTILSIQIIKN